jgi:hypothetical protein
MNSDRQTDRQTDDDLKTNLCQVRKKKYYCAAMRGRNPDNPSNRNKGIYLEQRLEINKSGLCNCLTTVQKDTLVLEIEID